MKLSQIVNPDFLPVIKKVMSEQILAKASYTLKGIALECESELKKYEEVRMDLVKRLGVKNEDGSLKIDEKGMVNISQENMKEYTEQLTALLETDLPLKSVKISELGDKAYITPQELLVLGGIITE
jgi:hypothetical protein